MNNQKKTLAEQFYVIKNENLDAIIFIQVGEFYQVYYHDAVVMNKELGSRIIGKSIGEGRKIPVCGIPVRWGEHKAKELVKLGYRVLICDQVRGEDNKVVDRQVVNVLKPKLISINLSTSWVEYFENYKEDMLKEYVEEKVAIAAEMQSMEDGIEINLNKRDNTENMSLEGDLLLEELKGLDMSNVTPLKAMILLCGWKEKYSNN